MDIIAIAALSGVVVGIAITFIVMRAYNEEAVLDKRADSYEEGWSHGYEVGITQPKQSRPRANKKVVS